MVYRTENEAAACVSDEIVAARKPCVSVSVTGFPISIESFSRAIFSAHPELFACVDNLSMQASNLGACWELTFRIDYTEVMPSTVSVVGKVDSLEGIILRDVKLHRRYTELVIPDTLEEAVKDEIAKATETPQFLDHFVQGVAVDVRWRTGCSYRALRIKYTYSCSYEDCRLRRSQMQRSVDEIVRLAGADGIEDWKKAFSVVKYCVKNWSYGAVDGYTDAEYSAYGALVHHTAVCMGISLAVCTVFSALGIPCRYIRGTRDGESHAWNLVFLRGGWFFIDVTDAIGRRDPYYHWGMTSFDDRTIANRIDVCLECTCPASFLRRNAK